MKPTKLFAPLLAAVGLLSVAASPVSATTYLVQFKVDGAWFGTPAQPYGLPLSPVLFGDITFDNTKSDGDAVVGLNWITGMRVWSVADVNRPPSSVQFIGGAPYAFAVFLDGFNSLLGSNNTAELFDGHSELACNGCVTILSTTAIPEPSSWALLILGLGSVGVSLRTRRRRLPDLL